jgi:hypothetical protein
MKIVDLIPMVAVEALGCPYPTISQAILMASINLCKESLAWAEDSDQIQMQVGNRSYEIDAPTGSVMETVLSAYCNGQPLLSFNRAFTPSNTTGIPTHYNMTSDRLSVSVYPSPASTDYALIVRAAFTPTLTTTTLPDFLDIDVVTSGAKARVMAMPGVTWSNPQLSAYYKSVFDAGITQYRIEEHHGRVPGSVRVQPRAFI